MAYTARLAIHEVVTVKPQEPVSSAAKTLKTANIGAVIVSEQGSKPLGIFTERDLCRRVIAEGLDPKTTAVEQVMTKDLVTVDASEPLDRVFELLADGRFRHLPITDQGQVVGVVSLTDLAKVLRLVYKEDKYIQYFADVVQSR
jgi:CBS domain-containing protein